MRGGGAMDAGGRRGGVGGRRRAAVARTCMFENLRESNSAEINAREEENTNETKSLIKIHSSSNKHSNQSSQCFSRISRPFKDFQSPASLQFNS